MRMRIGPTLQGELEAAGITQVPMVWDNDGVTFGEAATAKERAAVHAVLALHNPDKPDVTGEIEKIEQENPISHRALREFVLMIAALFPAESAMVPGIKKVADVDARIRTIRKRL